MKPPLDPFSKVVDDQKRWDPEWYSWLTELAAGIPLATDLTGLQSQITALQATVSAQAATITTLQTTSPPGLVFLSSQIASNSGALVFTGITSTYAAYQFHITAMRPSVNNSNLRMQISINGGSTWKNTSNQWSWIYSYMGGGAVVIGHNSTTEGNTTYFRIGGASSSSWGNSSEVMLYPNSGQNLNAVTWRSLDYYDAGSGVYQVIGSGLEVSDATPCNAVQFFFSSGTMVAGRITMYGLRRT